jgi:hypothetical protein
MALPASRTVVALAVAAAVAWTAYAYWPSEERRVRRRIASLEDVINETPTDGLGMVTRTAQLAAFFENDIVLDPGRGAGPIHGRERLLALASRAPNAGDDFAIRFLDVSVAVDGAQAVVHLTATLRWIDARGEENVDAREAQLALRKSDDWRIARVTAVDAFERPQS